MSKELSVPLSTAAAPASTVERWLRPAGIVFAGSLFAAICAHIALPLFFTPVPLTLQPFAILLLGLLLSPRMAAAALGAYLLEGAAGLPVFAPTSVMTGGIAHLLGPTGGYLLAYPAAAALISILFRRTQRGFLAALFAAALGDLLILACGGAWFAILTHASMPAVFAQTVVPFLPGDALKVATAAGLAIGASRLRRKPNPSPSNV
jgi:biotin transport system substrate-specific component